MNLTTGTRTGTSQRGCLRPPSTRLPTAWTMTSITTIGSQRGCLATTPAVPAPKPSASHLLGGGFLPAPMSLEQFLSATVTLCAKRLRPAPILGLPDSENLCPAGADGLLDLSSANVPCDSRHTRWYCALLAVGLLYDENHDSNVHHLRRVWTGVGVPTFPPVPRQEVRHDMRRVRRRAPRQLLRARLPVDRPSSPTPPRYRGDGGHRVARRRGGPEVHLTTRG